MNGAMKNLQFLNLKPRSHVRIFYIKIYRSWAIVNEKVTFLVPSLSSERERTCVVYGGPCVP